LRTPQAGLAPVTRLYLYELEARSGSKAHGKIAVVR
jgi:hypothetical protein